jgi:hypothetical protein
MILLICLPLGIWIIGLSKLVTYFLPAEEFSKSEVIVMLVGNKSDL